MTESWRLAHDAHAIAGMAVVISYSSPLSDRALQRLIEAASAVADASGLKSAAPVMGFVFNPAGPMAPQIQGYQHNSIEPPPSEPGLHVDYSRQLHIDQAQIMYRTAYYKGWQNELADIRAMFEPLIRIASDVVGVANIRLEYRDVFFASPNANVNELLNIESGLVAPHAFEQQKLWHSYTGFMSDEWSVWQVNVDKLMVPAQGEKRYMVHMITSREQRLPFGPIETSKYDSNLVMQRLESMHADLIDLMKRVLKPDIIARMK